MFISRVNKMDGIRGDYIYDVFIREEEEIRRITLAYHPHPLYVVCTHFPE